VGTFLSMSLGVSGDGSGLVALLAASDGFDGLQLSLCCREEFQGPLCFAGGCPNPLVEGGVGFDAPLVCAGQDVRANFSQLLGEGGHDVVLVGELAQGLDSLSCSLGGFDVLVHLHLLNALRWAGAVCAHTGDGADVELHLDAGNGLLADAADVATEVVPTTADLLHDGVIHRLECAVDAADLHGLVVAIADLHLLRCDDDVPCGIGDQLGQVQLVGGVVEPLTLVHGVAFSHEHVVLPQSECPVVEPHAVGVGEDTESDTDLESVEAEPLHFDHTALGLGGTDGTEVDDVVEGDGGGGGNRVSHDDVYFVDSQLVSSISVSF